MGGERQLLCMARAMLRRNPVMLLDEATASMDVESDARLQSVLRVDMKTCTLITVAHRIGTIMDYDRILALSAGEVAEFGTPNELLCPSRPEPAVFRSLANEAGFHHQSEKGEKAASAGSAGESAEADAGFFDKGSNSRIDSSELESPKCTLISM